MRPRIPAIVVVVALVVVFVWFAMTRLGRPGGSDVTLSNASRIEHDVAVAGRSVLVDTELQGDLAAAGSKVVVNQRVRGYVLAAGSQVEINGPIENDLWAAGRSVCVRSPVAENAWIAGASIVIEPEAGVGRDAMLAGRRIQVLAPVGGNLTVAADEMTLASEVRGAVHARTNRLRLEPGAVIYGDLTVRGSKPAEIAPEAKVLGTVRHHRPAGSQWTVIGWLGKWIFTFLAVLLVAAVALAVATPWTIRVGQRIGAQPGPTLLAGLGALFLGPLLALIIAITAIGLPLAILLTALYVAAAISAAVFVSYWIGGYVPHGRHDSAFGRIVAGALLISLAATLPWVGPVVQFLVILAGFGALVLDCGTAWRRTHPGHGAMGGATRAFATGGGQWTAERRARSASEQQDSAGQVGR